MRMYSAGEAIGPAWEHTKSLMWQDRRWGRLLKLSLVAFGAELGTGSSLQWNNSAGNTPGVPAAALAFMATLAVVLAMLALVLFIVFLYLGARLQLVQFDMLVLRDPLVTPAWRRHGHQTWRWAGLRISILLAALVVLLPFLLPELPVFLALAAQMRPMQTPGQLPHWHVQWAAIFAGVVALFALLLIALAAIRFVTNLLLPGLAIEDLRFGAAWARGWQIFRSDVSGMLLFAVVQPLFLFALGIALLIGLAVALGVLVLPFGLVGGLFWLALHKSGTIAWVVLGIFGVLAVCVVLIAWVLLYLAAFGTLLMFARAWSLYFLGGRYALLGDYLEPHSAVPVWTPPPSLPRDHEDGGPDLPADPALA